MHVALGYQWMAHHAAYPVERALGDEGHSAVYVGLSAAQRAGYDSRLEG